MKSAITGCKDAQQLFSSYLDGQVSGAQMHQVSEHLNECLDCQSEYASLERGTRLLSSLGPKQAPADLALKIRIAVASDRSRSRRSAFSGWLVRVQNSLNSFMFPATAGLTAAVLFFAAMLGFFPVRVIAYGYEDGYNPPRLEMSDVQSQLSVEDRLVVDVYVDAFGRVENYQIISGRDDAEIHQQLNRILLFTVFAPAQLHGHAVPGRVVLSFSHINVRG